MAVRTKDRIVWGILIALGVILLLGLLGSHIQYKKVYLWVCPISGSTKRSVTWFGGFTHNETASTALERWIKRKEPSFEPQWQLISVNTYSLTSRGYGCGRAPEIYQLGPILDDVVGKFSDEKISSLVAVLRHGSQEEQRQAIQRISDEYFGKN